MSAFSFSFNPEKRLVERRMAQSPDDSRQRHQRGYHTRLEEITQVPVEEDLAVVQRGRRCDRSARVMFRGVSWRARYDRRVPREQIGEPGTSVRVICQQGNTLIVESVT